MNTQTTAKASSAKRNSWAVKAAAAGALAVVAAVAAPTAAHAAYSYYQTDNFSFSSSNSAVKATGAVKWYKDGIITPVFRGEYSSTAKVTLMRTGCLYAKIDWTTITGTASWPPSGSASTTSDGWYRKCGAAGTTVSLAGQAYASHTLARTCLRVGYSTASNVPRSYQSSDCMYS